MSFSFAEMKFQLDTVILFDQTELLNEFFEEASFLKNYIKTYKELDKKLKGKRNCGFKCKNNLPCKKKAYNGEKMCNIHKNKLSKK